MPFQARPELISSRCQNRSANDWWLAGDCWQERLVLLTRNHFQIYYWFDTFSTRKLKSSKKTQILFPTYLINRFLSINILGRPMSPHLSVYKWSIPMTMSAFNRIFAFALTFGFLAIPALDLWTGDAVASISQFGVMMRETQMGTGILMGLKASV